MDALTYASLTVELTEKHFGENSARFLTALDNFGMLSYLAGNGQEALKTLKRAKDVRFELNDPGYPESLSNWLRVSQLLQDSGENAELGEELQPPASSFFESDESVPSFVSEIRDSLERLCAEGRYLEAEPRLREFIRILRHSLGEKHPEFIQALNQLGFVYVVTGNFDEAQSVFTEASERGKAALGDRHPLVAGSAGGLAMVHQNRGEYANAEPLLENALGILRESYGEMDPNVANALSNLAMLRRLMGNYGSAEGLLKQALEIYRFTVGEQSPAFAQGLDALATLRQVTGDLESAETLLNQAGEIYNAYSGEQSLVYAQNIDKLACLYALTGRYQAANTLYEQALTIYRGTVGDQNPLFAATLNNQSTLNLSMGDYAAAEALLKQALRIHRDILGEESPIYAVWLNNLALLYQRTNDFSSAADLLNQAIRIQRAVLGTQHPDLAASIRHLALLEMFRGYDHDAESHFKQALEIYRKAFSPQHQAFALTLLELGQFYLSRGNPATAEPIFKQAHQALRLAAGEQHPMVAESLFCIATAMIPQGQLTSAKEMMKEALAVGDHLIGQMFSIGSEKQRSGYLKTIREYCDAFLSLINHTEASPSDARFAVSLSLRRKAIESEALATQRDALLSGRYPKVATQLQKLTQLRSQISQKTLAGADPGERQTHEQLLADWNAERERLEATIARQVPEMNIGQKLRSIDLQAVAKALPANTTLVDFFRFTVFDFDAVWTRGDSQWKPARYLAFAILAGEPETVEMIDLGEAEPIDRMIATFRETITAEEHDGGERGLGALPSSARGTTGDDVGLRLRGAIFDPLLKAIGNRRRLMISPDGDLSRLPFEVLPTDDGRRLIDDYRISYLSAGRDVMRFQFKSNRKPSRSLVAADPDFDLGAKAMSTAAASSGRRSRDFKRGPAQTFERLPGTSREGQNIAAMLDAELWTEGEVLDARLKRCQSPRILHLATHGFFLEDQKRDPNAERFGSSPMSISENGMQRLADARFENPLLRSGLALAGVNTWLEKDELMEEAEDGLLTAEDVSGLNLLDTELVVLSACDTGLGEVHVGEGVFGLRRAFVLAGAKTLVMSLWEVPDEQTRELMEDFYRRILGTDGGPPQSCADALREAQLGIKAKHPEPYYWGAFICQGYDGPLSAP